MKPKRTLPDLRPDVRVVGAATLVGLVGVLVGIATASSLATAAAGPTAPYEAEACNGSFAMSLGATPMMRRVIRGQAGRFTARVSNDMQCPDPVEDVFVCGKGHGRAKNHLRFPRCKELGAIYPGAPKETDLEVRASKLASGRYEVIINAYRRTSDGRNPAVAGDTVKLNVRGSSRRG